MSRASRTSYEQAKQAALMMMQKPEADGTELVQDFVAAGISEEEAHELIVFLPLAFGRRMLRGTRVTFQPRFDLVRDGQKVSSSPLNNEPIYRVACAVAEECYTEEHNYLAVAGRSAELQAINGLLNKGSELKNIVMSPPLVDLPLRSVPRGSWWQRLLRRP